MEKEAQTPELTEFFFERDGAYVHGEGKGKNPNPETTAFTRWLRKYKPGKKGCGEPSLSKSCLNVLLLPEYLHLCLSFAGATDFLILQRRCWNI